MKPGYPTSNLTTNFADDPERARRAGQKSKRGKNISTILGEILECEAPSEWLKIQEAKGIPITDRSIKAVIACELVGLVKDSFKDSDKIKAIQEILDRQEGKAVQKIQQVHEDVKPLKLSEDKRNSINDLLMQEFQESQTLGDTQEPKEPETLGDTKEQIETKKPDDTNTTEPHDSE